MSLIRPVDRHEFSFVPGFGDDVRRAVDYGFSREVARVLRERHPAVEVVLYMLDVAEFRVFVRGDNGKLFRLGTVGRSSSAAWQLVDDLDRSSHQARHETLLQAKRDNARRFRQHQDQQDREAVDAIVDTDATAWMVRKYRERVLNTGDPFKSFAVPRSMGVSP